MNASDSSPQARTPEAPGPGQLPARKSVNRRLQERIPADGRVLIACADARGVQRRIRARAINMSKSGVLVQADQPVARGTLICLQTVGLAFIGRACVRHCTQKGMKYDLGLYVPDRMLRNFEPQSDRA